MKHFIFLTAFALSVVTSFTGCSKKEEGVDTVKLEASFQTADAGAKSNVDKAVAAIKNANYSGAITELQKAVASGKLNAEQEKAIKDVMEQLQKMVVDGVNKAAEGANQALGDLQKSISK